MKKTKLLVLFLFLILLTPCLVSAVMIGNVEDIVFDITSRPYYISENPEISGYVRNVGDEVFDAYVIIYVIAPDGTIYDHTSVTFSAQIGTLYSFPIDFSYLFTEGVGEYDVQVEFWRSIALWPDENLDVSTDSFYVIFNEPGSNQEYLVDDNWHHPSDPYILDWAAYGVGGGANTQEKAAENLKSFVYNYITYTHEESCDGTNENCGDRSTDYWIIFDEKGDCNDFADLYTSFARALNIPTGYVVGREYLDNPTNPFWVFPDYGPQEFPSGGFSHAWAESIISSSWKHIEPTGNKYNDPLIYIEGRYSGNPERLIVRKQNDYSDGVDSWTGLNKWEDVTRIRPYDSTWQNAVLSLPITYSTPEPVFVGKPIEIIAMVSHSGDMTARNSYLSLSKTSGLTTTFGNIYEALGSLDWTYPGSTKQWNFYATDNGNQDIILTLDSDDTSPTIQTISYNILQPPTITSTLTSLAETELQNGQFDINLTLINSGDVLADCVSATINLPSGLNLTENNQTQFITIAANSQVDLIWGVTPSSLADYSDQITISINMDDSCPNNYGYGYSENILWGIIVVDTIPPEVSLIKPLNQIYDVGTVDLEYTVDETAMWCGYSLNGAEDVTITENITIENLDQATYNLILSCRDENNNVGTDNVTFSVDWNDIPVVDYAEITPSTAYTTDNLICENGPIHDEDNDNITLSYKWYKNDILQESLIEKTLLSNETNKNELWKCSITPNDGEINGIEMESNPISIGNSPPVLDLIENINVTENELVIINPSANDADGDSLSFIFSSPLNENGEWQTDYNSQGTYVVTVTATDINGGQDSQEVTITVNNINRNPIWVVGLEDITLEEDFESFAYDGGASVDIQDPDGDEIVNASVVDENVLEVDCEIGDEEVILNPVENWYGVASCTIRIEDGYGGFADDTFLITVNSVNDIPEVLISSPIDGTVFNEGDLISFVGSATDVEEGDLTTSLEWDTLDGSIGSGASFDKILPIGKHDINARVADSEGASTKDKHVVYVNTLGNTAPIAIAGDDISVYVNNLVTLDGSASSDPENDTLTYTWIQKEGPSTVLIESEIVNPTFTPDETGTYVFKLMVNDGILDGFDSIIITVSEQPAPPGGGGGGGSGGGGSKIGGNEDIIITTTPKTVTMKSDTRIVYSLNNEGHYINLEGVYDDYITLTIRSDPFNVDLYVEKNVKVDTDGNGIDDLLMRLENIFATSARVTFRVLKEVTESGEPETGEGEEGETGDEITGAVVGGGSGWSKALIVVAILAVIITIGYLAFTGKGGRLVRKLKIRNLKRGD